MSLRCTGLDVVRGGRRVVAGVALDLPRGQLHVIVGPNGAGKSSLLAALTGELAPSAGGVVIAGRPLADWQPRPLAQTRALLGQRPELPFAMAAWQLVSLGRLPHGATPEEDDAVVQHCLERFGLLDLADRDARALSGGEVQRVNLARVVAQLTRTSTTAPAADAEAAEHAEKPGDTAFKTTGWLLLDEPTAALDLGRADQTLQLLRSLCSADLGVVAVVHDLGLALRHADTVTLLHDGRCVASGPPTETLQPALVEAVWGVAVDALRDATGAIVALVPKTNAALAAAGRGL